MESGVIVPGKRYVYRFRFVGFEGYGRESDQYNPDRPVDITVCSDTLNNAIEKVKTVIGKYVSTYNRKITIDELY